MKGATFASTNFSGTVSNSEAKTLGAAFSRSLFRGSLGKTPDVTQHWGLAHADAKIRGGRDRAYNMRGYNMRRDRIREATICGGRDRAAR